MSLDLSPEVLPLLGLTAVLVATLVFLIQGTRGSARTLRKVEPAFDPGSTRLTGVLVRWLEGRSRGFGFSYRLQPATANSPGAAVLMAQVVAPFDWKAVEVGQGSQLVHVGTLTLVQLGFLRDAEIGDPDLDRRLRFAATSKMDLAVAFGGESPRAALRRLADTANFRSIAVHRGRCKVQWSPRKAELDDSPDTVRERMARTADLLTSVGISPGFPT